MTPLLSSALLRAQTDDRLAALAAAGHDRAFEAIVERYRRPLQRYLRRLLSETLAEDVLQATFLSAWSSLRAGTQVRDLRPWLYRIAHNAAINSLKKVGEAMEEIPESAGGFATEPALELERRDEMRQALTIIAALPSRQRAALLAVAVDGRAHSDVAAELGLTDGAVRQLVHRARNTLRTTATAMTPAPLLHWMLASAGDSTIQRVAEVAAGAGAAGAASMSLKAGAAAVIAAGALATGGTEVAQVVPPEHAAAPAPAAPQIAPAVSPSLGPGGGASFASATIAAPAARGRAPAAPGATPSTSSGRGQAGHRADRHGRGRDVNPSGSSTQRAGGEAPAPPEQGLARRPAGAVDGTSPNRGPGSVTAGGGSGSRVGTPTAQPARDGGSGNSGPGGGGASGKTPSMTVSSSGKGVKGGGSGSGTSGPGPSGPATSGKGVSGGGGAAPAKTATAPAPEPAPQPDPMDGMKGGGMGGMRNMGTSATPAASPAEPPPAPESTEGPPPEEMTAGESPSAGEPDAEPTATTEDSSGPG